MFNKPPAPAVRKAPSVLMAVPTFGLDPDPNRFMNSFLGAMNEFIVRGWKVSTFFAYRRPISVAENEITSLAITHGFDYIFRMDDDVNGFQSGMVNKLIDADKEIISGAMFTAGFPYSLCAFNKKDKTRSLVDIYKHKELGLTEVDGRGIQPCDMTATPFTLIKTTIFEKIMMPYYEDSVISVECKKRVENLLDQLQRNEITRTDAYDGITQTIRQEDIVGIDSIFFQKLLDAGIQPYVHMDVQLNHRNVTPWNRHYLYNAEARAMLAGNIINKSSNVYPILVELFGADGKLDPLMLKGCHLIGE